MLVSVPILEKVSKRSVSKLRMSDGRAGLSITKPAAKTIGSRDGQEGQPAATRRPNEQHREPGRDRKTGCPDQG